MIERRKSIVGLSLLAVFAFCAFSAQGASAAWETASHTTAFTCVKGGGELDFSDPHCDHRVAGGSGEYGHEVIPAGTSTDIDASSTETSTLKGTLLGASVEIVCHKTSPDTESTSFIENTLEGTKHDFHGTIAVNFTECTLNGNGSPNCEVKEGKITLKAKFHAVEEPVSVNMAIEFEPHEAPTSTTFVEIQFTGSGCLLASAKVKGKARGTGASSEGEGATIEFKPADEELTFGGNAATFEGKFTTTMVEGNGISVTTVT